MKRTTVSIISNCLIMIFFIISSQAEETSKGTRIHPPPGFKFKPNFKIYRGNNTILGAKTSFTPHHPHHIGAKTTYYVDITKGKNSNDGLSETKPFKSLWCALQKKGGKNIVIAKGRYDYDDGWQGITFSEPLTLKSSGGTAIITSHIPVEFKRFEKHTYKGIKTQKERWGNVVDLSQALDKRVLKKAKKLPLQPGEYYVENNALYICTLDKRQPDKNILTLLAEPNKNPIITGDCYMENIELWGGYHCLKARIPEGKLIMLNNVVGKYCHGSTGFQLNIAGNGILYNCKGFNNYSDDFNWHALEGKSGTGIEINCLSRFAGNNNKSSTVNASTAHDKIKLIRINGDYQYAQNRVIADVGHAQSWNIACIAQNSRHNDKKTPWWSQNWSFAEHVTAWVDTCYGNNQKDTSARGWSAEGNAQVYIHNSDINSGNTRFNKEPINY